jgi:hypothetical protein
MKYEERNIKYKNGKYLTFLFHTNMLPPPLLMNYYIISITE